MPPQILRITGGRFKGQKIKLAASSRPPSQKLRESLFQQIGDHCHGKVLDLFAGSGTLGIEALSRGAEFVQFVEKDRAAVQILHRNLHTLDLTKKAHIYRRSVLPFLKHASPPTPFNLIFCDPPFRWGKETLLLEALLQEKWLAPEGLVILRTFKKRTFSYPLPPIRTRTLGESTLTFHAHQNRKER